MGVELREWHCACLHNVRYQACKRCGEQVQTHQRLGRAHDPAGGAKSIRLPGTKKGDMSSRAHRPEVRVSGLQFAPTGREFAATTTEGLLMFSLDSQQLFDPFELELDVTPKSTRSCLLEHDYGKALFMALKLNQPNLIREVIEQTPADKNKVLLMANDLSQRYRIILELI